MCSHVLAAGVRYRTEPEREVCWLYGLLDDGYQVFAQLYRVHRVAQDCTKACGDPTAIVSTPIQAPIDTVLDAVSSKVVVTSTIVATRGRTPSAVSTHVADDTGGLDEKE